MALFKHSQVIDGLRGISIIAVLVSHYKWGISFGGRFGVSLFFFISGFLITRLLVAEYEKRQSISMKNFYIKRALRLYPALLLLIIVAYVLSYVFHSPLELANTLASLFYFMNYQIIYFDLEPNLSAKMLDQLWSLSVEEHFYLLFPILFAQGIKYKDSFVKVLFGLIILALAIRLYITFHSLDNLDTTKKIYMLTQTRFDAILFGCLAAMLSLSDKGKRLLNLAANPVVYFLVACLLYFSFKISYYYLTHTIQYTIQGICFMLLATPLIIGDGFVFLKKIITQKPFLWFGKMSYSIYLFHKVGICLAIYFIGREPASIKWQAVAITSGLAFSLVSYYLVERNMLSIRKKFGSSAT